MTWSKPRPPPASRVIQPTHPTIEAALDDVDFPITKRELMEDVAGRTVEFGGRNADLREIIRDLRDDAFESEDELRDALDAAYGAGPDPTDEGS